MVAEPIGHLLANFAKEALVDDVFSFTADFTPLIDPTAVPTDPDTESQAEAELISAVVVPVTDPADVWETPMPDQPVDIYGAATPHAAAFYAEHGYLPAGAEVGEEWSAADVAYINAFIAAGAGWL